MRAVVPFAAQLPLAAGARPRRRSLVPCAAGALVAALALPSAADEYEGNGYVQDTLHTADVTHVEILDIDGDGRPDIASLDASGTLTVNFDAALTGWTTVLTGYTRMVVTRGTTDRLYASNGSTLVQITPGSSDSALSELDTGISTASATSITANKVGGNPRLAIVDSAGYTVTVYSDQSGDLVPSVALRGLTNPVYDAVALDWDGNGETHFALLQDDGLHVVDSTGTQVSTYGFFPATLEDSILHVLPGEGTQWGHDVLLFHHRPAAGQPVILVAVNAYHGEYLVNPGFPISQIRTGDFLASKYDEIMLVRADVPEGWFLKQQETANESDPFSWFDPFDTHVVDLSSPSTLDLPADVTTTMGDIDGDGDADVVGIEDGTHKLLVLVSDTVDDESMRPSDVSPAPQFRTTTLTWDGVVNLPDDCDKLAVVIWRQPATTAGFPALTPIDDDPLVLNANDFGPVAPGNFISFYVTATLPAGTPATSIFQIRLIPYDSTTTPPQVYPERIVYWSPDAAQTTALESHLADVYPWLPPAPATDAGGGIVRRPRLGPPKATGPKGVGAGPGN